MAEDDFGGIAIEDAPPEAFPTPFTSYSIGRSVGGTDETEDIWTNRGYSSKGRNLTPGVVAVNTKVYPIGTIFKDPDTGEAFLATDKHGNKNPNVVDFYTPPSQYKGQAGTRNLTVVGRVDKIPTTPQGVQQLLSQYGNVPEGESAVDFLNGKTIGNGQPIPKAVSSSSSVPQSNVDEFGGIPLSTPHPQADEFGGIPIQAAQPASQPDEFGGVPLSKNDKPELNQLPQSQINNPDYPQLNASPTVIGEFLKGGEPYNWDSFNKATGMLWENIKQSLSPLIGPTEQQKFQQAVPFGKNEDGSTKYEYRPLDQNELTKYGLLATDRGVLGGSTNVLVPYEQQEGKAAQMGAGALNALMPAAEFMGSRAGAATLALEASPFGIAKRIVSGGFAADMASSLPQQIEEYKNAETLQDKTKALFGIGTTVLFAGTALGHAAGVSLPKIDDTQAKQLVKNAPTEILKTAASDPEFRSTWQHDPAILDKELENRANGFEPHPDPLVNAAQADIETQADQLSGTQAQPTQEAVTPINTENKQAELQSAIAATKGADSPVSKPITEAIQKTVEPLLPMLEAEGIKIQPHDNVKSEPSVSYSSDGEITFNLQHPDSILGGASTSRELNDYLTKNLPAKIDEEAIHAADLIGLRNKWRENAPDTSFTDFVRDRNIQLANDLRATSTNEEVQSIIYSYTKDKDATLSDNKLAMEFNRAAVQKLRTGQITEEVQVLSQAERLGDRVAGGVLRHLINAVQTFKDVIGKYLNPQNAPKSIQDALDNANTVLDRYGQVKPKQGEANAIQEQSTAEGVLRNQGIQREGQLQGVEQQDQSKNAAQASQAQGQAVTPDEFGGIPLTPREQRYGPEAASAGIEVPRGIATGIKNAVIDEERAARGLAPLVSDIRMADQPLWDKATELRDKNPGIGYELTAELLRKPRPTTKEETAVLVQHRVEQQNRYQKAVEELTEARKSGDKALIEEKSAEVSRLGEDNVILENVLRDVGAESALAFRARQLLAHEDYSLANMVTKKRLGLDRELTPKEEVEIQKQSEEINRTQKELDKVTERSEDSRIQSAIKAIEKSIADYERRLKNQDFSPLRKKGERLSSEELDSLREKRDELRSDYQKLKEASGANEPAKLNAYKKRIQSSIDDLQDRLSNRNFAPKIKKTLTLDKEAQRLQFENFKAKEAFNKGLFDDQLRQRSAIKKVFSGAGQTVNTLRAIMTSFDLSAVLRQGGFITLGHPVRALKSFPAMFRAFASEKAQHAVNAEIQARENAPLYSKSGLYLSDPANHKLSKMEEAYMSRWAHKIPIVAGSERAYTTFLNKLRADSFDAMAKTLTRDGKVSDVDAKAIANFINVATGRGSFGDKGGAGAVLNTVFFSPRLVQSRFQLLAGQPLYKGSARSRALVASEYARFLAGVGVVYALASAAKDPDDKTPLVETDPRSSDFGKIRFGNTRIDPLSGLGQETVLISRLATGEKKTAGGNIVPIRGEDVPYGGDNSFDIMTRFARTKFSPLIGSGVNLLTGENVVGQPTDVSQELQNIALPLSLQDVYKVMIDQGVPRGTAISILSIFGAGIQTYQEREKSGSGFGGFGKF